MNNIFLLFKYSHKYLKHILTVYLLQSHVKSKFSVLTTQCDSLSFYVIYGRITSLHLGCFNAKWRLRCPLLFCSEVG